MLVGDGHVMMTEDSSFAYGTLMCEDIMREVSGIRPSHVPGTLKGYRRRSVFF